MNGTSGCCRIYLGSCVVLGCRTTDNGACTSSNNTAYNCSTDYAAIICFCLRISGSCLSRLNMAVVMTTGIVRTCILPVFGATRPTVSRRLASLFSNYPQVSRSARLVLLPKASALIAQRRYSRGWRLEE